MGGGVYGVKQADCAQGSTSDGVLGVLVIGHRDKVVGGVVFLWDRFTQEKHQAVVRWKNGFHAFHDKGQELLMRRLEVGVVAVVEVQNILGVHSQGSSSKELMGLRVAVGMRHNGGVC